MTRRESQSQEIENRRRKRLEPTIGHIDLKIDPDERAQAQSAARWRRFRRELVNWMLVISLFVLLVAGCVGAAVFFGVLQYPQDFTFVKLPGALILAGFIVLYLAQITGAVLAFQSSLVSGCLSLLIPGYVFMILKREGSYWPIAGSWLLGVLLVSVGAWLLA
ncbi:hypothetical protein [Dokdonella sp.]|uniref:hypothetical protein n=1 Tax=Dokdonella sp. TaxID=2291710 RepID=UPI003C5C0863